MTRKSFTAAEIKKRNTACQRISRLKTEGFTVEVTTDELYKLLLTLSPNECIEVDKSTNVITIDSFAKAPKRNKSTRMTESHLALLTEFIAKHDSSFLPTAEQLLRKYLTTDHPKRRIPFRLNDNYPLTLSNCSFVCTSSSELTKRFYRIATQHILKLQSRYNSVQLTARQLTLNLVFSNYKIVKAGSKGGHKARILVKDESLPVTLDNLLVDYEGIGRYYPAVRSRYFVGVYLSYSDKGYWRYYIKLPANEGGSEYQDSVNAESAEDINALRMALTIRNTKLMSDDRWPKSMFVRLMKEPQVTDNKSGYSGIREFSKSDGKGFSRLVYSHVTFDLKTRTRQESVYAANDTSALNRAVKGLTAEVRAHNEIANLYNSRKLSLARKLAIIESNSLEPELDRLKYFDASLWAQCYAESRSLD